MPPELPKIPGLGLSPDFTYLRMMLLGPPNTGKTTSALTFPNPIVLDGDNNLPPNVPTVEFWNADFIHNVMGTAPPKKPNRRDGIVKWLQENLHLLQGHTLILDPLTKVDNWFHEQVTNDPTPYLTKDKDTRESKINVFWVYGHKVQYLRDLMTLLNSHKGHLIVTCHESIDRDEKGNPNGKIEPIVTGKWKDCYSSNFTAIFRTVVEGNPQNKAHPHYLWQVVSDSVFSARRPHGMNIDDLATKNITTIPATYEELKRRIAK